MRMIVASISCLSIGWMLMQPMAGHADHPRQRAEQKVILSISAQPLGKALNEWASQTGYQVLLSDSEQFGARMSPAVSGAYTPEAALRRLLANSGLKYEFVAGRTVSIAPVDKSSATQVGPSDQMRLAAVNYDTMANTSREADTDSSQVVVEGQRERSAPFSTANLDLTRTEDDVLPFTVFTGEEILQSGAIDLREFLGDRLPQNLTDPNDAVLEGTNILNDPIDLRGWGAAETVLLLNGRRMAPQNQDINDSTAHTLASLRAIPLGSIERIEVLTSAGSAIYGVNASGGVINIITRRDSRSGQVSVNYQTPMDVLRPRRSFEFSLSTPARWGFGLRLGGAYNETEPMRVGDRARYTLERYRRLAMERDPSRIISVVSGDPSRTSTYLIGATPNVRARVTTYASGNNGNPGNLFAALPEFPRSNFTTVPEGYTGEGELAQFTPATYNLELADARGSSYGRQSYVTSHNTNFSINVGLERRFGRAWDWSLEYSYHENQGRGGADTDRQFTVNSANSRNPLIPAAAPFNVFEQDIAVALVDPNLDRPELQRRPRNMTWEFSSTLRGQIGQWRGFIDAALTQNHARARTLDFYEPPGGWRAAFLSGAYNPLVDTRVVSPASAEFYEHYIARATIVANDTRTARASLKASGPIFHLPAGSAQLTTGLDWSRARRSRSDFYVEYRDSISGELLEPLGGIPIGDDLLMKQFNSPNSRLSQLANYGGYAEATVPLLGGSRTFAWVRQLELFASTRLDRMENRGYLPINSGVVVLPPLPGLPPPPPPPPMEEAHYRRDSTLSAVGLRYEMVEGLALRASYSAGFKPPSFTAVLPGDPPTRRQTNLQDPIRKESFDLETTMYITGGNPDLEPESTDAVNIGLILKPPRWTGLRLSIDYLRSVRSNAITSLSVNEALLLESQLPGRIQRGEPDGHASGVGPITFVDARYINLREIASRSVDVNLEQRIAEVGAGRLLLRLAATRNLSFKVQTTNDGPSEEQVRNPEASTSRQIAWNGNAQVRWESARFGIGWSARYHDYLLIDPDYLAFQGSDRAAAAFNHDLSINLRLPEAGGSGGMREWFGALAMNVGVKNVFDRKPRFWAASSRGVAPYDSSVLPGRTVWMQLRKDFR